MQLGSVYFTSDFVDGLFFNGKFTSRHHWVRLMTPMLTATRPTCLSVGLVTTSRMMLYQKMVNGSKHLLADTGSNNSFVSTDITVALTPVSHAFLLQFEWPRLKLNLHGYYAVIRHITMQEGHCPHHTPFRINQKCTFEHNQCGFNFGAPVAIWMPVLKQNNTKNYSNANRCKPYRQITSSNERMAVIGCTFVDGFQDTSAKYCLELACLAEADAINFFPDDPDCDDDYCTGDCRVYQCHTTGVPPIGVHQKATRVYFVVNG